MNCRTVFNLGKTRTQVGGYNCGECALAAGRISENNKTTSDPEVVLLPN